MASPNTLKMRNNGLLNVPPMVRCIIDINTRTGQSTLSTSDPINQISLLGVLMSQQQVILESIAKASMGLIDPNKPRIVSEPEPQPEAEPKKDVVE
jgi:hypothetical protein